MCYNGKCLHCIPVENGCLALAIISAVVTGLAMLACIIMGFLIAAGLIYVSHSGSHMPDGDEREATAIVEFFGITAGVIIAIVGVASLVAFIFSVLLCNGIGNRRPGQVKAYFVYGVLITLLTVIAAVTQLIGGDSDDRPPAIMGLIGCAIYSMFLVMVHQTYIKLTAGVVFKGHKRLIEDRPY